MSEKGGRKRGPKAHSKNSDFGTPFDLGTLQWPSDSKTSHPSRSAKTTHSKIIAERLSYFGRHLWFPVAESPAKEYLRGQNYYKK